MQWQNRTFTPGLDEALAAASFPEQLPHQSTAALPIGWLPYPLPLPPHHRLRLGLYLAAGTLPGGAAEGTRTFRGWWQSLSREGEAARCGTHLVSRPLLRAGVRKAPGASWGGLGSLWGMRLGPGLRCEGNARGQRAPREHASAVLCPPPRGRTLQASLLSAPQRLPSLPAAEGLPLV